jgi:hypothetical protein
MPERTARIGVAPPRLADRYRGLRLRVQMEREVPLGLLVLRVCLARQASPRRDLTRGWKRAQNQCRIPKAITLEDTTRRDIIQVSFRLRDGVRNYLIAGATT